MDKSEITGIYVGVFGMIITFYGFYLIDNMIVEAGGIALLIISLAFLLTIPEEQLHGISLIAQETLRSYQSFADKFLDRKRIVYVSEAEGGLSATASVDEPGPDKLASAKETAPNPMVETLTPNSRSKEEREVVQNLMGTTRFSPIGFTLANQAKHGDDYESTLKKILVHESSLAQKCSVLTDLDGGYTVHIEQFVLPDLSHSGEEEPEAGERRADSPLAQICASVLAKCTGEKIVVKSEHSWGNNKDISLGFQH